MFLMGIKTGQWYEMGEIKSYVSTYTAYIIVLFLPFIFKNPIS